MSRGFAGTTQKLGCSHCSRDIQHPWVKKKHGRFSSMSRLRWLFSSTATGWHITSTPRSKPPQRNTTRRSFVTFVMLSSTNYQICEQQKLGSSIMIFHPPTVRIWSKLSSPNTTFRGSSGSLLAGMAPCDFWLFPNLENAPEGNPVWVKRRPHAVCNEPPDGYSKRCNPEVFPTMMWALGGVCAFPRRLLWRGQGFVSPN